MSVSVSVNGTSYTIPQTGETGWGAQVTAWIQAVSSSTLQKNGGTFTLTADADFGASFGLKVAYLKSRASAISTAGIIRLASTESVAWRNSGDSANLLLLPKAADNTILTYGGIDLVDVSTAQTLTNKTLTNPVITGLDLTTLVLTQQGSTPSTPAAGKTTLYSDTSDLIKHVDDAGTVRTLVDLTATQTLTNKTLTSAVANTTVFTQQGSAPSTPSANRNSLYIDSSDLVKHVDDTGTVRTLVDLASSQTLTNKELTSPVITSPNIQLGAAQGTGLQTCTVNDYLTFADSTIPSPSSGDFGVWTSEDGTQFITGNLGGTVPIAVGEADRNYIYSSKFNYGTPTSTSNSYFWSTYADAAGTSPVNGTGGSPNVTLTVTSTTPIRGVGSALFTKDAANRQGQGFSYDFSIDAADLGRVVDVEFEYICSAAYADNDMSVWLYDVTNAALISAPSGLPYQLRDSPTTVYQFKTQMKLSATGTSFRLIFHVASTNASAYTVKFDSIKVIPSKTVYLKASDVSGTSMPSSTATTIAFDNANSDVWGMLNTSTGVITIPESGYYNVSVYASASGAYASADSVILGLTPSVSSPIALSNLKIYYTASSGVALNGTQAISLIKGETLEVQILSTRAAGSTNWTATATLVKM